MAVLRRGVAVLGTAVLHPQTEGSAQHGFAQLRTEHRRAWPASDLYSASHGTGPGMLPHGSLLAKSIQKHGITSIRMDLRKAPPWFAHWRLGEADSGEKKCSSKRAAQVEQGPVGMGIEGLALSSDPQFPLVVAAGWRLGEADSPERRSPTERR